MDAASSVSGSNVVGSNVVGSNVVGAGLPAGGAAKWVVPTSDSQTPLVPQAVCSQIVIPARLESTRLPRKLLLCETGKPLIQHTYEAARRATRPRGICVAADHPLLADAVRRFGGQVEMTDPAAASGTDRVAEVARRMSEVDIFVNVQGDEPEISPAAIDLAVALLERTPSAVMSTLATPIRDRQRLEDPACVKVVFQASGQALYFSRSPIPCARDWDDRLLTAHERTGTAGTGTAAIFHQHVGLYAYRRDFLLQLAELPRSPLEKVENLEQLRVLEAGFQILVGVVDEPSRGIDTPDDYRAFVSRLRSC